MHPYPSRRRVVAGAAALGGLAHPLAAAAQTAPPSAAMQVVLDYVQGQKTTGFLVVRDRKILVERNWPAPAGDTQFRNFTYETTAQGGLLEDVASQQKSFVSMLVAVAIDKGLLDAAKPVSAYIGAGWSRAAPGQEAAIRVIDVLTMSSGLTERFDYAAPPGTVFLYNTPVYAIAKRVIAAAAKLPLETITADWLTTPAGMRDTSWRKRPAVFADVGNPTGLVTSPRDTAIFGQIVLDAGRAANGRRIVSETQLQAMFTHQPGLRAPLVAERRRLRDPAAGHAGRRAADPGRARRPGRRPGRAGPQALCGPQPQAGGGAHGRRLPRQGLRPRALAAAGDGAGLATRRPKGAWP
jgi:CubicO group peptidase (beta-lactamase class C family)